MPRDLGIPRPSIAAFHLRAFASTLVLFPLAFAFSGFAAAEFRVEARLQNPAGSWTVGDPVPVAVTLSYQKGDGPPTLAREFPDTSAFIDETPSKRSESKGEVLEERVIRLAFFEAGRQTTGDIRYTLPRKGGPVEASAPAVPVAIRSVVTDKDKDLAPPEPPRVIPYPTARLVALAAVALALLATVAWLFWRWWRRRRGVAAAPLVPPDKEALGRLSGLEALDLPGKGEFRLFYFHASEIVKDYLGKELRVLVLERTTTEILRQLPGIACLGQESRTLVGGFLTAADLVKFAGRKPDLSEAGDFMRAAFSIVEGVHGEFERHRLAEDGSRSSKGGAE